MSAYSLLQKPRKAGCPKKGYVLVGSWRPSAGEAKRSDNKLSAAPNKTQVSLRLRQGCGYLGDAKVSLHLGIACAMRRVFRNSPSGRRAFFLQIGPIR